MLLFFFFSSRSKHTAGSFYRPKCCFFISLKGDVCYSSVRSQSPATAHRHTQVQPGSLGLWGKQQGWSKVERIFFLNTPSTRWTEHIRTWVSFFLCLLRVRRSSEMMLWPHSCGFLCSCWVNYYLWQLCFWRSHLSADTGQFRSVL